MIVVDASVWVSTPIPADAFERMSSTWPAGVVLAGEDLAGPSLVLAEIAGAVARRLSCPLVTWDAELIHKTHGTITAAHPSS